MAVNWISVNVRMIAIRPGMMKRDVRRSGLYQGRTRRSIGSCLYCQPPCCANVSIDIFWAMPAMIDMACDDVVLSEALTIRKARAGALR